MRDCGLVCTGMWVFSPFSPLMIYSVCLYFTMLVILWFTTGVRLQELMATHRHFNVMFFVFMAVSYFLIILAIPVINWPEANNIARYLSSWARFQVSSIGFNWLVIPAGSCAKNSLRLP